LKQAMKPRFKPELERNLVHAYEGTDLEGSDASEQMFTASLEAAPVRSVFTVNQDAAEGFVDPSCAAFADVGAAADQSSHGSLPTPEAPGTQPQEDASAWKQEVTARVTRYRSRRPRTPRYPSLLLKFENTVPEIARADQQLATINLEAVVADIAVHPSAVVPEVVEATGRLLEFPRTTLAPPAPLEELAEPVPGLPRILDVPDLPPAAPALGGILIENAIEEDGIRRPGFEIPLHGASLASRMMASSVDLAVVLCALAEFGYIFLRITQQVPPRLEGAAMIAVVGGVFWAAYQYAFLVYVGSTPGLAVMRLQLDCFDGLPVPRKTRRWRALAAVLSAVSLGLGYVWCFLDEDQLCWHDRISMTYTVPITSKPQNS
jgi:uncharacterized RDD family membrane protein YckC